MLRQSTCPPPPFEPLKPALHRPFAAPFQLEEARAHLARQGGPFKGVKRDQQAEVLNRVYSSMFLQASFPRVVSVATPAASWAQTWSRACAAAVLALAPAAPLEASPAVCTHLLPTPLCPLAPRPSAA